MKFIPIFLFLSIIIFTPRAYLAAQNRRDSTVKKTLPDYKMMRVPKANQSRTDTTPKPRVPVETNPTNNNPTHDNNNNDESNTNKPPRRYVPIDTVRPVPVETNTYVGSVLRLQKIYVNDDALELIRLLNPGLANKETVMSDYRLVLPDFPEPDSRSNRSVNQQFKIDKDPDGNVNNIFTGAALQLDTLANIFNATGFEVSDAADQRNYSLIKSLLPALTDLNRRAMDKIKRTSRKTVSTLTMETNALNKVLTRCNNTSTLSGEDIKQIYSLMADMNILLSGITDRKLRIPQSWDNSFFYNEAFNYSLASYNPSPGNDEEYKRILSDDDPRKFNIYIFRRSLVESGSKDPEMGTYDVSYVIPALADDVDAWEHIPDPASTVHCYFAPARFKFTITDPRSKEVFSATEDLYDAQKDPDQKWTIMSLIDRHPTYRLVFLLP